MTNEIVLYFPASTLCWGSWRFDTPLSPICVTTWKSHGIQAFSNQVRYNTDAASGRIGLIGASVEGY